MSKDKGGRPLIEIDYTKLEKLCAIHCTGEECASILGVDYDTLNRHLKNDGHGGFTEYFKKHSAAGKMSLRRKQYEKAVTEGNVPMLIWLGKQMLGQKDRSEVDNTSTDGTMSPTGKSLKDFYADVQTKSES